MGIGLLLLVSVGKENIYLSSQPEITFFKMAYKRYTNFSIESIAQYFKSSPDFGRRVTVNLSKNTTLTEILSKVSITTIARIQGKISSGIIRQFQTLCLVF
jgi:hypothetical protein